MPRSRSTSISWLPLAWAAGALLLASCQRHSQPAPPQTKILVHLQEQASLPAAELQHGLAIAKAKFLIKQQDTPEWGHEETWILQDKNELSLWGLDHLTINFEQGRLQGLYFGRNPGKSISLQENLTLVGVDPRQVSPSSVGWQAVDKTGQLIDIRENGTWYQMFEHRPGH
jgi:hypothetical protein